MNLLLWTAFVTEEHFPILEKIKKTGYDGVEIPLFDGDAEHYKKIKKELDNLGLGCTAVTVVNADTNPISPDASIRKAGLERIKWALDMTSVMGGDLLAGPYHSALGVFSGQPPTADERKRAVEVLTQAADHAQKVKVHIGKEAKEYKTFIAKVFDFKPAPGQFINDLPAANDGETFDKILTRANSYLTKKNGDLISLGAFGGYIVFGFDHTIVNVKGKRDFRVLGNAFWADANPNPDATMRGGSSEAGIIMVSYDKNKNGLPDDEWYEIEGAGHKKEKTIKNYEITYYRPDPNKVPVPGGGTGTVLFTDVEYILWKDNQGKTGYLAQNNAYNHSLDYWPKWLKDQDKITFKGTLLPSTLSTTGLVTNAAFDWGYADSYSAGDDYKTKQYNSFDISWAVDATGKKVTLNTVDFIKVYTAQNVNASFLGEISTDVKGAADLNIK